MRIAVALFVVVALAMGVVIAGSLANSGPDTVPRAERADPFTVYDPVRAGEPLPPGYRQLLRRDDIFPVYEPRFEPAADSSWRDSDLVIGVEIDGASKAYPVGFLNRREMVIDDLKGIPLLVTW